MKNKQKVNGNQRRNKKRMKKEQMTKREKTGVCDVRDGYRYVRGLDPSDVAVLHEHRARKVRRGHEEQPVVGRRVRTWLQGLCPLLGARRRGAGHRGLLGVCALEDLARQRPVLLPLELWVHGLHELLEVLVAARHGDDQHVLTCSWAVAESTREPVHVTVLLFYWLVYLFILFVYLFVYFIFGFSPSLGEFHFLCFTILVCHL